MRIAQIAPLIESVPPKLYGGTERIVSYLTEELVRQGHEVVLFASGDSVTRADLVAGSPKALRLNTAVLDPLPHHILMLEKVRQRADEFDILHFHIDYLHFPLIRAMAGRTVTTMHGRLDYVDLEPLFAEFDDMPLVSVSESQQRSLNANWVATVHHGLPPALYRFTPSTGDGYLAFLGRMSPEKRPDRAIEIAGRAGLKLKIAAKIDNADRGYFDQVVRPLLDEPFVEFIGEIGEERKPEFLGNARALLFPIDWPEPFGLVMIEAMACGTPTIAWRCASTPEVIEEGLTGCLVDSIEAAVAAVGTIDRLDRRAVRRRFEERFTVERMARDYLKIYRSLLEHARWSSDAA
jgi:glycosyltransferase involved in cell wall biosynthesis